MSDLLAALEKAFDYRGDVTITRKDGSKIEGYIEHGVKEGARLVVDGRGFSVPGREAGFFLGGTFLRAAVAFVQPLVACICRLLRSRSSDR